jgi:chromosome segregation ATPase
MSQKEGDDGRETVLGLSVADAVEHVVAGDDSRDPATVRTTLETVAEDGAVTRAGVDSALGHASKVVSTPETRTELAEMALSEARERAAPVADLGVVQSRLDAFEARLTDVQDRTTTLGENLQSIVGRAEDLERAEDANTVDDPNTATVYVLARDVRRLTDRANDVQLAADELQVDVEDFERWLGDPGRRNQELGDDVDALEGSLNELSAAVAELESLSGEGPGAGGEDVSAQELATTWADAALRVRLHDLLLEDLRAELADLRTWADREDLDEDDRPAGIEACLDDLDGQLAGLEDRLDDLTRPEWREQYGDRLADFEDALADVEPPVQWSTVQAELEEQRSAMGVDDPA